MPPRPSGITIKVYRNDDQGAPPRAVTVFGDWKLPDLIDNCFVAAFTHPPFDEEAVRLYTMDGIVFDNMLFLAMVPEGKLIVSAGEEFIAGPAASHSLQAAAAAQAEKAAAAAARVAARSGNPIMKHFITKKDRERAAGAGALTLSLPKDVVPSTSPSATPRLSPSPSTASLSSMPMSAVSPTMHQAHAVDYPQSLAAIALLPVPQQTALLNNIIALERENLVRIHLFPLNLF